MIVPILIAVLIISLIAAALAAILTIAQRYFADYGPCEITINQKEKITVQGGNDLLSLLIEEKIFIPSACGGRGTCGLCKLKVLDGAGPLLPTEEPFLEPDEIQENVRLSCQVKIRNDIDIEIPEELFAIQEYTCECVEIKEFLPDMRQFRFKLIEPETIDYIPGQYMQLLTPVYKKSSEEVYRAYSMSGDPNDKNHIETIIRLVPGGICTTYCFEYLKIGDTVKLNGPYGDFRLSDTDAPIIFVAGGSGIAPIKCILHQMKNVNDKRSATFYFGMNTVKEMFLVEEMEKFQQQLHDFTFAAVVANTGPDDDWKGQIGLVTQAVQRSVKNGSACEAYLCGSPGMIDAASEILKELGVTEDRIFYDKFA